MQLRLLDQARTTQDIDLLLRKPEDILLLAGMREISGLELRSALEIS